MKRERPWRSGGGEGPSSKRVPGGPMPSTLRVLLRSIVSALSIKLYILYYTVNGNVVPYYCCV